MSLEQLILYHKQENYDILTHVDIYIDIFEGAENICH